MKKIVLGLVAAAGLSLTACNDSFLDKTPVTGLTEVNAFQTYNNFRDFMWPCYWMFMDGNIATSTASNGWGQSIQYKGDMNAGYMESKNPGQLNSFAFQTIGSANSGNGWAGFGYIRRINLMLSHLESSNMNENEKKHWKAVGYFFHSFWYMELIDRFGDVPWVDKVLNDTSKEAYEKQISRDEAAKKVLEQLKWAEENIGDFQKQDGANTINTDCVLAAISRFGLREGTWRKYHQLGDEERYLKESVRASELLMKKYPTLYKGTDHSPASGYGEMWTTDDLSKVPGIILYRAYVKDINPVQGGAYVERTASHNVEMNQHTVDLYLMKNGLPIANKASGYHGDKTMYTTFRDRDPRLYQTVIPPYKVKPGKGTYLTWSYTENPADREYIDIMGANETCSNPGIGMKRLPNQNWSASLVPEIPRQGTGGFVQCRSKYYVWKLTCNWEKNFNNGRENVADKPIFKIEEVLLNWAEAKYELGEFDQSAADRSINLLRERAGVAGMQISKIDENFDPNRGEYNPKGSQGMVKVDPVLWEIRRERIIELMGEGFGFYDVRRWRMAPWFLNRPTLGIWTSKEKAKSYGLTLYNPETGLSDGGNGSLQEGYLLLFENPLKSNKGWLEKYYLYEVPTGQLVLNENLDQTPGWGNN